ncbi:MAG TPA: D-sedoheptulose 7-phosphate isomerase [Chitinophagaceae bacterium]|nr:D-sedoheptulose 7-phosphate isomerase [Chitinophagaceae bacterium]
MEDKISGIIQASIAVNQLVLDDRELIGRVAKVTDSVCKTFKTGHKVMFCGNGGSAADAQHLAAELSGRFYADRDPLPAEALHCNTSYLTAVANDYGFEQVYSRLLKGMGKPGDILLALSTSGQSANILEALRTARKMGITTVGMTGKSGGQMKPLCDYLLNIPSTDTPRIQESHILIGHIICQLVEAQLFPA